MRSPTYSYVAISANVVSTEAAQASTRAKFDSTLTAVRLIVTRAPQYIIPFWYAKEPMFWLPHGWFPWYAEWFLSLPRAPTGSVSIASWQVACTVVITFVIDSLKAMSRLVAPNKVKMPVKGGGEGEKTSSAPESKKEL